MRRVRKKDKRRQWGNILERVNANGEVTSLQARYQHPFGTGRITKSFEPQDFAGANAWLDAELTYLETCERTHSAWLTPRQRETLEQKHSMRFGDFVEQWLQNYRTKDGSELSGSSKRNIRADVSHFLTDFKDMTVQEITPEKIKAWYDKPHPEGAYAFHRSCQRFKAIMKAASTEGLDGSAPLRMDNPFIFPIPPVPDSGRSKIPPLTPEQLQIIYETMPGYTRLSVYLSALAGGLRIGEVCALQVRDIDLKNRMLTVRHSVNRGETDRGDTRLAKTKTSSSMRTVVLPDELVPLVEAHIKRYCDDDPEAMLFRPKHVKVLSQNTLRKHFNDARSKAGRDDVTFHALRATHATMLILSGGTLREAMNQLGHTSTEVAIKHYQRAVDAHTKIAANTLAEHMLPSKRTPEIVEAEYKTAKRQLRETKERLTALRLEMRALRKSA
ncbi:tyrosine-type recombinase/integrase [Bifidobacterium oedipodis]|uniref:Site-specific recombinase phage integrase family n=1 Tax=Bifidobacterium oedipodis TaxID=2675322 RepID=A0A7Y0HSU7_9BIFI|nr:site-specific integrase [Bifidobacterium sp. DSM 109957]NMM93422.1 site-specific recombinase phage integrase family [Bifidobacterium sp. DSM 109957]